MKQREKEIYFYYAFNARNRDRQQGIFQERIRKSSKTTNKLIKWRVI